MEPAVPGDDVAKAGGTAVPGDDVARAGGTRRPWRVSQMQSFQPAGTAGSTPFYVPIFPGETRLDYNEPAETGTKVFDPVRLFLHRADRPDVVRQIAVVEMVVGNGDCLLYTSDAAD